MDIKIKTALISVSDKSGLDLVIKKLHQEKIKLISTGGTAQFIRDMNIPVTDVSDITNFPEMMDGRIKTLHPIFTVGYWQSEIIKVIKNLKKSIILKI